MGNRNENQLRGGVEGAGRSSGVSRAGGTAAAPSPATISFLNGQCAPGCSRQEMLRGLFDLERVSEGNRRPSRRI
jgi:hypothetical protein